MRAKTLQPHTFANESTIGGSAASEGLPAPDSRAVDGEDRLLVVLHEVAGPAGLMPERLAVGIGELGYPLTGRVIGEYDTAYRRAC